MSWRWGTALILLAGGVIVYGLVNDEPGVVGLGASFLAAPFAKKMTGP